MPYHEVDIDGGLATIHRATDRKRARGRLWLCTKCGMVVIDIQVHDEWHLTLSMSLLNDYPAEEANAEWT